MKIGTKISLGFSGILALTAIVGAIGWVAIGGFASGVNKAQGFSQLVDDLHRLPLHIVEFERGDDASGLTKAMDIMDDALHVIAELAERKETSSITAMTEELRDYRDALQRYSDLYQENHKRQAFMAASTKEIDELAKQIYDLNNDRYATGLFVLEELEQQSELRLAFLDGANALMHATLSARQAEAAYQLDPNVEARERAASFMKEIYLSALSLRKISKKVGEESDNIKALSKGVKTYRKQFGAFIEAVDEQANVNATKQALVQTAKEVQAIAEGIAERQRKAFGTITEQARSARKKVSTAFTAATQSMGLTKTLLVLHDTEKEFFHRRDPAIGDRIEAMMDAATETLSVIAKETEDDVAIVQQTLDLLPNYRAAFAAAKAASLGQADMLASMHVLEVDVLRLADANALEAAADMTGLYEWGRLTLAAFCMIALILGISISYLTARSIVRPLKALTASISDLAAGSSDIAIPELDRADEIGDMARSMGIIRETGTAALRAQKTLENTEACLMMVDSEGSIVHINPAFEDLASAVRSDVKAELDGFAATTIEGQPFDAFHNEPALQHEQLRQLTAPIGALVSAGGHSFDLKLNPVFDLRGRPIGTIVSWHDRSAQIRLEAEVETLIDAATSGNLEGRLATDQVEGFMLTLCEGMNRLMDTVEGGVKAAGKVMSAMSSGDLSIEMTGTYHGIFKELQNDSNRMRVELSSIANSIVSASDALSVAAKEIASGTSDLTDRTQAQSSSVEKTSSSMSDLTETVKRNTEGAIEANEIAKRTRSAAASGHQVVGEATGAMEGIETAATKITDIVNMIDEIAFQTNLLALNASVEAARAGEAGKGFAVVASEVRALAQRSGKASDQIKGLIEETVTEIDGGVSLVQQVGNGLQDIVSSVNTLADLVVEITEASQEQTTQLADISQAVTAMGGMADQNSSVAEQTMAAVRTQGQQVSELHRLVRFFKTKNDQNQAA